MHNVMRRAKQTVDQAEVYSVHRKTILVETQDGQAEQVAQRNGSTTALRVIADGRLGTSFGAAPDHPSLLTDAREAAVFGPKMPYGFASSQPPNASPESLDPRTDALTAADLIELCQVATQAVTDRAADASVKVSCQAETRRVHVATTEGVDAEALSTHAILAAQVSFAGENAEAGVHRIWSSVSPLTMDGNAWDELLEWRDWGATVSCPSSGRLPVLLAPQASSLLTIPLSAGLDGLAVMQGVSPLSDRIGETILSERITLRTDRRDPGLPNARSFDDEGVIHQPRVLVESGRLQGFTTDLRSAHGLGLAPTGDAVRRTLFTEGIQDPPAPWLTHTVLSPGEVSWREMLGGIDEGILITGTRGLHSSNITQGHFSVGVEGFHIVGGKVAGRLERTLISGNLYSEFQSIAAVSRETEETLHGGLSIAGRAPYLWIDEVQVSVG